MKKIMLTAAAVATLASSTALAGMEDMFYVKANGGWEKLNKVRNAKSENSYFLGLGVGYYVMDNVRADLVFDHFFDPKHKRTDNGNKIKYKGKIDTLTLNGYVDLFDVSVAKVFIGAGVGMAQVDAKSTSTTPAGVVFPGKGKKRNNVTWAIHTGASTEFAPGVNGELFYSYRDFGKTKATTGATPLKAVAYKGHHVGVGVRFDM
jgi:opacity protein-like surface antigen